MKHWGLQFEKRMADFSHLVTCSRLSVTGARQNLMRAEQEIAFKKNELDLAQTACSARKTTLDKLIDLGPEGLKQWEGEEGEPLTYEAFRVQMDKRRA